MPNLPPEIIVKILEALTDEADSLFENDRQGHKSYNETLNALALVSRSWNATVRSHARVVAINSDEKLKRLLTFLIISGNCIPFKVGIWKTIFNDSQEHDWQVASSRLAIVLDALKAHETLQALTVELRFLQCLDQTGSYPTMLAGRVKSLTLIDMDNTRPLVWGQASFLHSNQLLDYLNLQTVKIVATKDDGPAKTCFCRSLDLSFLQVQGNLSLATHFPKVQELFLEEYSYFAGSSTGTALLNRAHPTLEKLSIDWMAWKDDEGPSFSLKLPKAIFKSPHLRSLSLGLMTCPSPLIELERCRRADLFIIPGYNMSRLQELKIEGDFCPACCVSVMDSLAKLVDPEFLPNLKSIPELLLYASDNRPWLFYRGEVLEASRTLATTLAALEARGLEMSEPSETWRSVKNLWEYAIRPETSEERISLLWS